LGRIAGAFLAEGALVHIFDLYGLFELVELVDLPRTFLHEFRLLPQRQLRIKQLTIKCHLWPLVHNTSRHRTPLSMLLSRALLRHHGHIHRLILAQKHQRNRILLRPIIIRVDDRHDRVIDHTHIHLRHDMLTSDLKLLAVGRAVLLQPVVHRTVDAHALAGALLAGFVGVDAIAGQGDQAEAVRDELIVECGCVLLDFD
jgi:hypothetical protein